MILNPSEDISRKTAEKVFHCQKLTEDDPGYSVLELSLWRLQNNFPLRWSKPNWRDFFLF